MSRAISQGARHHLLSVVSGLALDQADAKARRIVDRIMARASREIARYMLGPSLATNAGQSHSAALVYRQVIAERSELR